MPLLETFSQLTAACIAKCHARGQLVVISRMTIKEEEKEEGDPKTKPSSEQESAVTYDRCMRIG
jgi:hypothetical protein